MRNKSFHCPLLYPGNYSENERFDGNILNKCRAVENIDSFVCQTVNYNLVYFTTLLKFLPPFLNNIYVFLYVYNMYAEP